MSDGVSLADLTDHYIPAVARKIGQDWCDDQITFASGTVGVARLQWLVGSLERKFPQSKIRNDEPGILMVVPAGEQHTLGAIVLSSQLRRRGFRIALGLEATGDFQDLHVANANIKVAMISASSGTQIDDLRALVSATKNALGKDTPVVIGGTITDTSLDIRELAGADHVTSDVDEALEVCGLAIG